MAGHRLIELDRHSQLALACASVLGFVFNRGRFRKSEKATNLLVFPAVLIEDDEPLGKGTIRICLD